MYVFVCIYIHIHIHIPQYNISPTLLSFYQPIGRPLLTSRRSAAVGEWRLVHPRCAAWISMVIHLRQALPWHVVDSQNVHAIYTETVTNTYKQMNFKKVSPWIFLQPGGTVAKSSAMAPTSHLSRPNRWLDNPVNPSRTCRPVMACRHQIIHPVISPLRILHVFNIVSPGFPWHPQDRAGAPLAPVWCRAVHDQSGHPRCAWADDLDDLDDLGSTLVTIVISYPSNVEDTLEDHNCAAPETVTYGWSERSSSRDGQFPLSTLTVNPSELSASSPSSFSSTFPPLEKHVVFSPHNIP